MNARLFQLLGADAILTLADADRMDCVMSALRKVVEHGITGRVRMVDMCRPAIFQFDIHGTGKGCMHNPMLMVATNQEGADLIRKWVTELLNPDQNDSPTAITQVIGDFFPPPSPPSNDTKP